MSLRSQLLGLIPDWLDVRLRKWRKIWRLLRKRTVFFEIISGVSRPNNNHWTIAVADRVTTVDYLIRRFFRGNTDYKLSKQVPARDLRRMIGSSREANLAIVRCSKGQDCISISTDCWRVPDAVLSIIDLPPGRSAVRPTGNPDNLRRIRKYGLYAQITNDLDELNDFYHNAYLPHVRGRFRDLARPHSERTVIRAFKNGGLLWIFREGVRYAGVVFSISRNEVRTLIGAPVTDPSEAKKIGAVSATKAFLIDYAIENEFDSLNLGKSRPNLLDGVLLHKKSWGARIADDSADGADLQLSWRKFTPEIASWLYTTPLIVRESNGLSALTAVPKQLENKLCERHLNRIWSPGLSRINVFSGSRRDVSVTGDASIIWHSGRST